MANKFVTGKLYKFIEPGEDLVIESDFTKFFNEDNFVKDQFGYYSLRDYDPNITLNYIPVVSGTLALCLGTEYVKMFASNFRKLHIVPYFRFLIDNQITAMLVMEKNLYSVIDISTEK